MVNPGEQESARDNRVLQRTKTIALVARESTVTRINSIAELAKKVDKSLDLIPQFLAAAEDLDSLWETFVSQNAAVLEALLDLDESHTYSTSLEAEVRSTYMGVVIVVDKYRAPRTTESSVVNEGSRSGSVDGSTSIIAGLPSGVRLPKIPLPSYSGDLCGWPVFRDQFNIQIIREELPKIVKFYYLLGCLQGDARQSIQNIVVSEATFDLAWSTLIDKYDKPRQLATLIVDKVFSIPAQSQESLEGLREFLVVFSDQIAMLKSLNIPDLGEFLLFALSARCLPISTRKGFEAVNNNEFPCVSDMVKYVKDRVSLLEAVSFSGGPSRQVTSSDKSKTVLSRQNDKKSKVTLLTSKPSDSGQSSCLFCSSSHMSCKCPTFSSLAMDDRYQLARDKKVCFRCLNSLHWSNRCKVSKPCKKCPGRHHTLLHRNVESPIKEPVIEQNSMVGSVGQTSVLLGTAQMHVRDHSGVMQMVRAVIDSASQVSVISTSCVERLGLKRTRWTVPLTGLSGVKVPRVEGIVECLITPRYNYDHSIPVRAWVLPKVTNDMPLHNLPPHLKTKFSHLALADPLFDRPAPVDMLLGADVFAHIFDGKRVVLEDSLPAAFSTLFGWVIIGPVTNSDCDQTHSNLVSLTVSLEHMVQRFWEVEEPDSAPEIFSQAGQCEAIYLAERERDANGRFVVPLPFLNNHQSETFPGSRQVALRRFQNLERKLLSDEMLYQAYKAFMLEYESLGHMSVAPSPGIYFIPHHPVFKGAITSSKIRVVFDASAVASSKLSLNQCLHTGPKLQQDIVDILLRFRVHQFSFTADVCKMYRQVSVLPKYRAYQHIFWRASPVDELREYELNTVTYGLNCAPFLALRVLQDLAEQECAGLPDVLDALTYQTYVDDICVGADTVDSLMKLRSDLQQVLSRAGLELKKWSSNAHQLLSSVPAADRATDASPFNDTDIGLTKVLGLQWKSSQDTFGFDVQLSEAVPTKRAVLSVIARIFDPLGFLAPVIFLAKHHMQQIWKANLTWDEPLPKELNNCWQAFVHGLPMLSEVRIPRFLNTYIQCQVQLCGFCDASERGYAAVVYLRTLSPNNPITVSLLGSKTKMAPMKSSTVPRLELCAALLLARWMSRIKKILEQKVSVVHMFAWTDSQIVLSWLVNPHELFKVFVSNRVHQVHQLLPQCSWGYVRSAKNPADCASRGMLPSELLLHSLYWSGPDFLLQPHEEWDVTSSPLPVNMLPEVKSISLAVEINGGAEWYSRFSNFTRMLRVVAWIRRFTGRCQKKFYSHEFLSRTELDESLVIIVRLAQCQSFAELQMTLRRGHTPHRIFARLRPFLDQDGVVRINGRLGNSELPETQKHPILLAKDSHLSHLIVRHWHLVTCHSGPRVITSLIGRQFWIMSVRVVIRKVLSLCTICVRSIAQSPHPLMADLPSSRVKACRPFSRVGVDYAGPLQMRECRLRKARRYKVYIAVFVCMTVKAVHLEVVLDLTTDAFLAAFDRFVARRGLPSDIYSDCGTNFVGAAKQLRNLINHPDNHNQISAHTQCTWHFNPPSAPHFGGLWEAAVRSAKTLLVRVMGCHNPTLEEMSTVLCRIEAVLNSRPLTPMTTSPLDLDYLTPGHFLIGQPLLAVPDVHIPEGHATLVHRWKLLHQCHQSFWRRWSNEYLCSLQTRNKWTSQGTNLNVGDMVVVKDHKGPPTSWLLGRITSLAPGKDGVVRVVKVLTSQGEFTRPTVKLVLLPME